MTRRVLTFWLPVLLCACSSASERNNLLPINVDGLPQIGALHSTSEVSGKELTDGNPVSSANYTALRQFQPSTPDELAFAIYECDPTAYQPGKISISAMGCQYYVFLANFTESRWELMATAEAEQNEPT